MIEVKITTRSEIPKLIRNAERERRQSIVRAAAYVRRVYKSTLGKKSKPRPPGQPPTSRTGRAYRGTLFAADRRREVAFIGPSHRIVGRSVGVHVHGMRYKGTKFPKRPIGDKVIEKSAPRLPEFWAGIIK